MQLQVTSIAKRKNSIASCQLNYDTDSCGCALVLTSRAMKLRKTFHVKKKKKKKNYWTLQSGLSRSQK